MEAGFEIDGTRYEIPRLDTFTMDEAQILYELSGVVQEDFAPEDPEASDEVKAAHEAGLESKIRNPAFKRALAHISYRRAHPDLPFDAAALAVGKANALDVTLALFKGEPESPPEMSSPNEPESKPSSSEHSKSEDSGSRLRSVSDPQEETPDRIGTTESDTSSRLSAPVA